MRLINHLELAVVLLAFCSGAAFGTADDSHLDAWVTTQVKIALLTANAGNFDRVSVDTFDGRVILAGSPSLDADIDAAIQKARAVPGVREVRSLLGAPKGVAAKVDDAEIETALERAIGKNQVLAVSATVKDGIVHLTGKAPSLFDHLHALRLAWGIPGVHGVESNVKTPDVLYTKETATEWRESARIGEGPPGPFRDHWITSAVKLLLTNDPEVPAPAVGVDTRDGVVTLFGIVARPQAREAAGKQAHRVNRAKSVINDLQVDPRIELEVVEAAGDDLAVALAEALSRYGPLSDAKIEVTVEGGVARLSGHVPSDEHALAALLYARSVPGVTAVDNQLEAESR